MKKVIWKFKLNQSENLILELPIGAEILSVQGQKENPCLWALVDPTAEKEKRSFKIIGTGFPIDFSLDYNPKYIGTFQLYGGDLVFHLFELLESK